MPHKSAAEERERLARLCEELQQLFEEAQELQAQTELLLAQARGSHPADVEHIPAAATPAPSGSDPLEVPERDAAQTLDLMLTMLASFPLETQIAIAKTLALATAAATRAWLHRRCPPAA